MEPPLKKFMKPPLLISIAFLSFYFFFFFFNIYIYMMMIWYIDNSGANKTTLYSAPPISRNLSPFTHSLHLLFAFSPSTCYILYTWQLTRGGQTALMITTLLTTWFSLRLYFYHGKYQTGKNWTKINGDPLN